MRLLPLSVAVAVVVQETVAVLRRAAVAVHGRKAIISISLLVRRSTLISARVVMVALAAVLLPALLAATHGLTGTPRPRPPAILRLLQTPQVFSPKEVAALLIMVQLREPAALLHLVLVLQKAQAVRVALVMPMLPGLVAVAVLRVLPSAQVVQAALALPLGLAVAVAAVLVVQVMLQPHLLAVTAV